MSTYTDRAMELAEKLADAAVHDFGPRKYNKVPEEKENLRQHLEAGEPDCRTCVHFIPEWYELPDELPQMCGIRPLGDNGDCINFSKYKRADYTPLCEATK